MSQKFEGLDLGLNDNQPGSDDNDILGLNKFVSKPSPRPYQGFGGPRRQQKPTYAEAPQQPTQPAPASNDRYVSPFDDLGTFDRLNEESRMAGDYVSDASKVYKTNKQRRDDFITGPLKSFHKQIVGEFAPDHGEDFQKYFEDIESYEQDAIKRSKVQDGFFSDNSEARNLANKELSVFGKFKERNGLLDQYRKLDDEFKRSEGVYKQYKEVDSKITESLLSIPPSQRIELDKALKESKKAPKKAPSRKEAFQTLDSMAFEQPVYGREGIENIDKIDPRYVPKVDNQDNLRGRQKERLAQALRGDYDSLLSRREQVRKDRQLRDRGIFFSNNGLIDGRPLGMSRKDVDILDLADIRKTGIEEYKGKPIAEAIEELGGEERVKVAEILQSVHSAWSNWEDSQMAYLTSSKDEDKKLAMEAKEAFEGLLMHAAENGLTDEIIEQAESQGLFSAITNTLGNALSRGFKVSEMANYAEEFITNSMNETDFQQFITAAEQLEQIPQGKAVTNFLSEDNKSIMDAIGSLLFDNTAAIPELFAESLASFLPTYVKKAPGTIGTTAAIGMATPVPGGTAIGASWGARLNWGIASAAIEYTTTVLDEMKKLNLDWKNPRVFMAAWNNDGIRAKIRDKAAKRSISIGTLDAVSGVIGGRIATTLHHTGNAIKGGKLIDGAAWAASKASTPRFSKFQRAGNAALEVGADSATGGAGEVLAQVLTREDGEPLDQNSIAAEMFVGGGPGLIGAGSEFVRGAPDVSNVPFKISKVQETDTGTTGSIDAAGFRNQFQTFKDPQAAAEFISQRGEVTEDQQNVLLDIMSRFYSKNPKDMADLKIVVADRTPFADANEPASFSNIDGEKVIFLNRKAVGVDPIGAFLHESGHLARVLIGLDDAQLQQLYSDIGLTSQQDTAAQYITKNQGQSYNSLDDASKKKVDKYLKNSTSLQQSEEWFSHQFARVLTGNTATDSVKTPLQQLLKGTMHPLLEGYIGSRKQAGSTTAQKARLDATILQFMGYDPMGFNLTKKGDARDISFGQYQDERPGLAGFLRGENKLTQMSDEDGVNYLMREIRVLAKTKGKAHAKKVRDMINRMSGGVLPTDDSLLTQDDIDTIFTPVAEAQILADEAVEQSAKYEEVAKNTGSKDAQKAVDTLTEPKLSADQLTENQRISSTDSAIQNEINRRTSGVTEQGKQKPGLESELAKAKKSNNAKKAAQIERRIENSKKNEATLQKRKKEYQAALAKDPVGRQAKSRVVKGGTIPGQTSIDVNLAQNQERVSALNKLTQKGAVEAAKKIGKHLSKNRKILENDSKFAEESAAAEKRIQERLKAELEKNGTKGQKLPVISQSQIIVEMLDINTLMSEAALTSSKVADDLVDVVSSKAPDPERVVEAYEAYQNEVEDTVNLLRTRKVEISNKIKGIKDAYRKGSKKDSSLGAKSTGKKPNHRIVQILAKPQKGKVTVYREWNEQKNEWSPKKSAKTSSLNIQKYNKAKHSYKSSVYGKARGVLEKEGIAKEKIYSYVQYLEVGGSQPKAKSQKTKAKSTKSAKMSAKDVAEIKAQEKISKTIDSLLEAVAPEQASIDWKDTPHFLYHYKTGDSYTRVTLGQLADRSKPEEDKSRPAMMYVKSGAKWVPANEPKDLPALLWQYTNWRLPKEANKKASTAKAENVTEVHWTEGKNKVLSNFSIVKGGLTYNGVEYNTLEGAYQANKSGNFIAGFENLSGADAQKKARADKISTDLTTNRALMKELVSIRYKSDPDFKQALDKAKAEITHPVSDKYWKDEFPKILNEVRGKQEKDVETPVAEDISEEDFGTPIQSLEAALEDGRVIQIDIRGNGGIYGVEKEGGRSLEENLTDELLQKYFGKPKKELIQDMELGKPPESKTVEVQTVLDPDIKQAFNIFSQDAGADMSKKLSWTNMTLGEYVFMLDAARASVGLAKNQKTKMRVKQNKDGFETPSAEKVYFQPDKGATHVSMALWKLRQQDKQNKIDRPIISGSLEDLTLSETVIFEVAEGRTLELIDDREISGYKLQRMFNLVDRRAQYLKEDIERMSKEPAKYTQAIETRKRALAALLFDPHAIADFQGEQTAGLSPTIHSGKPWSGSLVEFLFYQERSKAKEKILTYWEEDIANNAGVQKALTTPSDRRLSGYADVLKGSPAVLQELLRIEADVFQLKSFIKEDSSRPEEHIRAHSSLLLEKLTTRDKELQEEALASFDEELAKKKKERVERAIKKLDITPQEYEEKLIAEAKEKGVKITDLARRPLDINDYTFLQAGEGAEQLVSPGMALKGEKRRKPFKRGNVDLGIPVFAIFAEGRNEIPWKDVTVHKTTLGFNELADPIRAYAYEKMLRKNVNTTLPKNIAKLSIPKARGKGSVEVFRDDGVWKYQSTKKAIPESSIQRAHNEYLKKVQSDISDFDTSLSEGSKSDNHVSLANLVAYVWEQAHKKKGNLEIAMASLQYTPAKDKTGRQLPGAPSLGLLPYVWFKFIPEAYKLIGLDPSSIEFKKDSKYKWEFDAKKFSYDGVLLEGNMFKDGVPDPKDMAAMFRPVIQAVVDAKRLRLTEGLTMDEDKSSLNTAAGGDLQQFDTSLSDAADDLIESVFTNAGVAPEPQSSGVKSEEDLNKGVDENTEDSDNLVKKPFSDKDWSPVEVTPEAGITDEQFDAFNKRVAKLRKNGKGTTIAQVHKEFKDEPAFWNLFGLPTPPKKGIESWAKKLKTNSNYPRFKETVLDPDSKPPTGPGKKIQPQESIDDLLARRGPVGYSLGAKSTGAGTEGIFKRIFDRVAWKDAGNYIKGKARNKQDFMAAFMDQSRASTKVLSDALKDAGVTDKKVLDALDVRALWHQYYGKTDEAVRQAEDEYIEPIMDALRKHDISNEMFGNYLIARAAPSRNIHLKKLYEAMSKEAKDENKKKEIEKFLKEYKGRLSGIDTDTAIQVVKKIEQDSDFRNFLNDESSPLQKYYQMNSEGLLMRGSMGLIQNDPSKGGIDEVAAMMKASSHFNWKKNGSEFSFKVDGKDSNYSYSPMQGFEGETEKVFDHDRAFEVVGKSSNSGGKGWDQPRQTLLFKGAFGRPEGMPGPDPKQVFATAQNQFFEGAIRAHKNEVSQAFGLAFEVLRAMAYFNEPKKAGSVPLFDLGQKEFKQVKEALKADPAASARARELFEGDNRVFNKEYNQSKIMKGRTIETKESGVEGFKVFRREISRDFANDPYIFVYRKNGEPVYVEFARTEAGARAASSIKNLRYEALPKLLQGAAGVTRFMASMFTSRNPSFIIPNFVRDYLTAAIHLTEDGKRVFAKQALNPKRIAALAKGVWQIETKRSKGEVTTLKAPMKGKSAEEYVKTLIANGEWASVYQYAKQAGAKVGYFRLDTIPDIIDRLEQGKSKNTETPGLKQWKSMVSIVDNANTMLENSIRMSAFVAAVESGSSVQEAAKVSRNVTVDFNQKGTMTQTLGSMFVFFGASMNSLHRMFKTFAKRTPAEQRLLAGSIVTASFVMALFNRAFDDDEDEEKPDYDRISDYKRHTNFIVTDPREGETGYYHFPLPLGYNVFWSIGQYAADMFARYAGDEPRGGTDPMNGAFNVLNSFMNTANPMGGASLSTAYIPSAFQPVAELSSNKNFMGLPIRKEDQDWGKESPAFKSDPKRTQKHWTDLSETINSFTGGDDNIRGSLRGMFGDDPADNLTDVDWNFSGSQLEHLFTGWLGGPGQLINSIFGGTYGMNTENYDDPTGEAWKNQIPILNRFYRASTSDGAMKNSFYKYRLMVKNAESAVKQVSAIDPKEGKVQKERFKDILALSGLVKRADTVKSRNRKIKTQIINSKIQPTTKLQRIAKLDRIEHSAYVDVIKKGQSVGIY